LELRLKTAGENSAPTIGPITTIGEPAHALKILAMPASRFVANHNKRGRQIGLAAPVVIDNRQSTIIGYFRFH
jgi:hypothetical protein